MNIMKLRKLVHSYGRAIHVHAMGQESMITISHATWNTEDLCLCEWDYVNFDKIIYKLGVTFSWNSVTRGLVSLHTNSNVKNNHSENIGNNVNE